MKFNKIVDCEWGKEIELKVDGKVYGVRFFDVGEMEISVVDENYVKILNYVCENVG